LGIPEVFKGKHQALAQGGEHAQGGWERRGLSVGRDGCPDRTNRPDGGRFAQLRGRFPAISKSGVGV
jgi:hypothetical protein